MKWPGKKYLIAASLVLTLGVSLFLFQIILRPEVAEQTSLPTKPTLTPQLIPSPTPTAIPTPITQFVNLDIPFTSQAPFGNWSDPREQNGCEEAAVLMVIKWKQKKGLSKQEALSEIIASSLYQEEHFGTSHDTSAKDTAERIIKGYYNYPNVKVKNDITIEDIIEEIMANHPVIIPADGQVNGNPYYTPPGPERHMIVIKGYDPNTREFITNDPGTRHGANYRYPEKVLYNAIRDYPTGVNVPIQGVKKAIIVIL
ncbi:MAG: C39 family peptidase [bacterium]|nr:C39 family peptidase [bacterium]